jgi:hypothetical protein
MKTAIIGADGQNLDEVSQPILLTEYLYGGAFNSELQLYHG